MPRSAAGLAAPSRAVCARVASSARVGPLAGRTRTHAGVAVPRARVEVSRNFSRVRMGEGRLGAANRRLGAHSRRAQTQGRLSKMLCDATKYFDERPSPQITSRGSRRGRPMGWNSKVAKNSSKKATSCSLEHPLPPPFTVLPLTHLPLRRPLAATRPPLPAIERTRSASASARLVGRRLLQRLLHRKSRGVRQTKTESPSGSISTTTPLSLRGGSRPRRAGARPSSRASTRRSRNPASRPRSRGRSGRGGRPCPRGTRRP